jgi:hypothetical protein
MGALRDKPQATKDDVFNDVVVAGDYPGGLTRPKEGTISADYVFGRMLRLYWIQKGVTIICNDGIPRRDYQAWCDVYPTYDALLDAAEVNVSIQKQAAA